MEDKFLIVAKEAALDAGRIIASYFGKEHQYKYKNESKSDFATQADLESQAKIVDILTKNFPSHNIIAEENARINNNSEYTWVIDPLDGTFSFSIGMPNFAVSIGLLKNHKPVLGVVFYVMTNDLYYAQKDQGAFLNGKKIQVSKKDNLVQASMIVDLGHSHSRGPKMDLYIIPLSLKLGQMYSIGTTAGALALAGRGAQDGVIAQAWIWDFVAGTVIVREAGGKVTDFKGEEPDWTKDRLNVLATNGLIHQVILEAINKQ